MSNFNDVVQIRKWALAMIGGVPSLALITVVFYIGSWKGELDQRIFDTREQKREVLSVTRPENHWTVDELDTRYMPRGQVEIYLKQIEKNQEKIMDKLNVN